MGIDDLAAMNARIYSPKWDTKERIDLRDAYDKKYGAGIRYLPASWIDIVGPMLDDVKDVFPDIRFVQVKEKFGMLRVYMDPGMSDLEQAMETVASFALISRDVYAVRLSNAQG